MALDYHLAEHVRVRMFLLPRSEMEELLGILDALLEDPSTGILGAAPPYFPYRPGAFVTQRGPYRICYELANDGAVLNIFSISPLPENPDLWSGFEPIDIDC